LKKQLYLQLCLLLASTSTYLLAQPYLGKQILADSLAVRMDEYLQACVATSHFNGVTLIAKNGNILLQKGYGWKNFHEASGIDSQTIFQIGSLTKSFTATLILRLQEEGYLHLSDKLSTYFPSYPQGDKITLKHLLTHTSGIVSYTETDEFTGAAASEATQPKTKEQILALFEDKPLMFKPGTKYSYSNSGYFLLGWIAQKVVGKPYEQLMREKVFEPLQIGHSGFDFIHLQHANKATGYSYLTKQRQEPSIAYDSTISYAAGAMYSTLTDVYKWARSMTTEAMLPQKTWQQAFTPYKGEYGYGFFSGKMHQRKFIGHSGGTKGFSAHFVWFEKGDVVIILLSNVLEETNLGAITSSLASIVFEQPYQLPKVRQEVILDTSILKQYVGEYKSIKRPRITFHISIENGRLVARKKGGADEILYGETESLFFLKEVDAQVEFIKEGEKGLKVIVHQNGKQYISKKVN
jgi:CubicO group peptidase (beta-lactamase class C family)